MPSDPLSAREAASPSPTSSAYTASLPDHTHPLETRLAELERKVDALKPRTKDRWEKASTIASILTPLITFGLGFWVVSLTNLGFERQRLRVSNVTQMQTLISELRNAQTTSDAAETAALALASFGPAAITPLLNLIQGGEPNVVIAAAQGLRAIGMSDPDITCQRLIGVIESRSQLYSWATHRAALGVIGDLACADASNALARYQALLQRSKTVDGLARFARFVREQPAPTAESIDLLTVACTRAIEALKLSARTAA